MCIYIYIKYFVGTAKVKRLNLCINGIMLRLGQAEMAFF